jgi:hypothetical protein
VTALGLTAGGLLALGLLVREVRLTLGAARRGGVARTVDGSLLALAAAFVVVTALQLASYLH